MLARCSCDGCRYSFETCHDHVNPVGNGQCLLELEQFVELIQLDVRAQRCGDLTQLNVLCLAPVRLVRSIRGVPLDQDRLYQ